MVFLTVQILISISAYDRISAKYYEHSAGYMISANETISSIRKKKYKILVIDDDDNFRMSFCLRLERIFEARIDDVESGKKAIEILQSGNSYDLIFIDAMMPGMSGVETYDELRKFNRDVTIVMMSAYLDNKDWQKLQDLEDLEDVSLLPKPIPENDLLKILDDSAKT